MGFRDEYQQSVIISNSSKLFTCFFCSRNRLRSSSALRSRLSVPCSRSSFSRRATSVRLLSSSVTWGTGVEGGEAWKMG